MQHSAYQKPQTGGGQQTSPPAAGRVIPLHPLAWEQVRAWAKRTLTEERIAEPALVTVTLLLWGWLVFCLYHALQHYTIRPLP